MGWQFRKALAIMPRLQIAISRSGLSISSSSLPGTLDFQSKSVRVHGLPEAGSLDLTSRLRREYASSHSPDQIKLAVSDVGMKEIRSASTDKLSNSNLEPLRNLLKDAYEQRAWLESDLENARHDAKDASRSYYSWDNGSIFKRVFKKRFARRRQIYEEATAKAADLGAQLEATKLGIQIDIEPRLDESYKRLRNAFASLSTCRKVWDKMEFRELNRVSERSAASETVSRAEVYPSLLDCQLIRWEMKVPHFPNRNGGDLYIYPGFILYRASEQAFALLDFREVALRFTTARFIEDSGVPADAEIIDYAWFRSNKDGSPDRRFRDNYQLPVTAYGLLEFTSDSGLNEAYYVSNPEVAERFAHHWQDFHHSFQPLGPASSDAYSFSSPNLVKLLLFSRYNLSENSSDWTPAIRHLVTKKPRFWQYTLAEKLLRRNLKRLKSAYKKCCENLIEQDCRHSDLTYRRWFLSQVNEFKNINDQLTPKMDPFGKESWGENSPPSAQNDIFEFVNSATDLCLRAVLQELQIRSTAAPAGLDQLRLAIKGFGCAYVDEMLHFTDQLKDAVDEAQSGLSVKRMLKFKAPSPPQSLQQEADRLNKKSR